MSDVFTQTKRSAVMSLIRSHGNKATELRLIAVFRAHAITGWRRGSRITGKPDFVFPSVKIAVFVDGCFWHGCPKHGTRPKQNAEFWREKIARNRKRDRLVIRTLRGAGWQVVRIWEHALLRRNQIGTVRRLSRILKRAAV